MVDMLFILWDSLFTKANPSGETEAFATEETAKDGAGATKAKLSAVKPMLINLKIRVLYFKGQIPYEPIACHSEGVERLKNLNKLARDSSLRSE
jgi:hypothetical protein